LKKKNTSTSVSSSSPFSNSPPLSSLPPSSPRHQQGRRQRRQAPATCHRRPPPPVSPLPFLSLSPDFLMWRQEPWLARLPGPRQRTSASSASSATLVSSPFPSLRDRGRACSEETLGAMGASNLATANRPGPVGGRRHGCTSSLPGAASFLTSPCAPVLFLSPLYVLLWYRKPYLPG